MLNKTIALLLAIFPISIFLNIKFDFLYLILVLVLLSKTFLQKKKRIKVIVCIAILLCFINYLKINNYFNLDYSSVNHYSVMSYIYRLISFIIISITFSNKEEMICLCNNIKKYINFITFEIIISQLYIMYLFISNNGFIYRWGMNSFVGASSSPHIYAYSQIIMIFIIFWISLNKKKSIIYMLYIIPVLTSLFTGARTPTAAVIALLIFINLSKKYRMTLKTILWINGILIVVILFSGIIFNIIENSNFVSKFTETSSSGNFMNGRQDYWDNAIYSFNKSNVIDKLFGRGVYYSVILNKEAFNQQIWAHSDFLDILISFGLILLIIYVICYIVFFYRISRWNKRMKYIYPIFFIYIFLSSTNGLINYNAGILSLIYLSILSVEKFENDIQGR